MRALSEALDKLSFKEVERALAMDDLSLGVTAAQIRDYCRNSRRRPYEILETTARQLSKRFRQMIEEHLTTGYVRDGFRIPTVYPPLDWDAHNRSFSFHLHAWDAITDLLSGHSSLGDQRYLDASLAHARCWLASFQLPVLERFSNRELDALVVPNMPTAWYDMAVGQRSYRLAYLLNVQALDDNTNDHELEFWWMSLRFHLLLLNRDHFFRKHSNHGIYQALGHLASARRFLGMPGMDAEMETAKRRLHEVLEAHFSADGAHREHSPGYHYMLLGTILNACRSGLLEEEAFQKRKLAFEEAMTWMVKPDLCLATFGDTDPRYLERGEEIALLYESPGMRYIVSAGTIGSPPALGVKAFPDGGYAFARLHAPNAAGPEPWRASYLGQIACFHSRVHKHADHLSFVWYDKEQDILIDPARYAYAGRTEPGSELFEDGFWYADPKRVYVETTRAHNCVEIDGRSYRRKGVRPFGSALRGASEQDGLAVTDCQAVHLRTITHWRGLILAPGEFLVVLDHLSDRLDVEHDWRQWFQLAPQWRVAANMHGLLARSAQASEKQSLRITSMMPGVAVERVARGQKKPVLQGWMSDSPYRLVPCTSVCFHRKGRNASFATLFNFGAAPAIHDTATRFNVTMTAGSLRWRANGRSTHLKFERGRDATLRVTRLTIA